MRHLLIIFSFFLLTSPLFGQSERPETIVVLVGTLGDFSDSRKQVIQNTLSQELTKYFRLVPQDKFEEAQEKAFEELEYEECTEDQCIMMIQELLKIDNAFSLLLVERDGKTELSLTWFGLGEKKVLIESCVECNTKFSVDSDIVSPELNRKIEILAKKMVQQISHIAKVETETEEKSDDTTESYTFKLRGIIGAGSSEKTEFNNKSMHFVWGQLGIGLSEFYMKSTSPTGQKLELQNQSWDLSYNFAVDHPLGFGVGFIVDGEAKSSTLNVKSKEVGGNRAFFFIGRSIGKLEVLGGYQYSIFEYKSFTSTKDLKMTAGLIVFGIGIRF